jgi:hypothetical protein
MRTRARDQQRGCGEDRLHAASVSRQAASRSSGVTWTTALLMYWLR